PRIRAHDQRRQARADPMRLEPLRGVPFGTPGRDDHGHRLGRRRDDFGGTDEVDRGPHVQREVIPESLERLGQRDHAQSRHGNTSSITQLPPQPFPTYNARPAPPTTRTSEAPAAAGEAAGRPPPTRTLI